MQGHLPIVLGTRLSGVLGLCSFTLSLRCISTSFFITSFCARPIGTVVQNQSETIFYASVHREQIELRTWWHSSALLDSVRVQFGMEFGCGQCST